MNLGTRGSRLARWQAEWVQGRLAARGVEALLVVIKTRGDAEVDRPLHQLEGKGFFTKEIEDALLEGRIDVAVHSLKDLPTRLPDGLTLGAVPARHDPRDALVATGGAVASLLQLAPRARVGTSSLRRLTQLRYLRPDLELVPLRGNVPTRVRKVEEGDGLDAALLALAGLERLALGERATPIDPLEVMPAPGQGALGLEIRTGDKQTSEVLRALEDPASAQAVAAERTVLAALGGGCQAPVAAWVGSRERGAGSRLFGRVTAADGAVQLTASADLDPDRPEAAGEAVARLLEAEGAVSLLAR
ncbi:MAG TPA: hydroxymethylbilane synthase [Gemmatimonadales bacterium]|nr:hydroxymethylbilane synthase [Gemmatimonadales bacterium]